MRTFKQITLLNDARAVAASQHKGLVRQAVEIMRMKKRNPGLGATDYFAFRLYDQDYLGTSCAEDFVGWREEGDVPLILNVRTGVAPAWDKFMFTIFARAYALPVPRLRALYRPGALTTTALADVTLETSERLAIWLRTQEAWPLFAKPCYGALGVGCYRFTGYRHEDDMLLINRGETLAVNHFLSRIVGDVSRRRAPRAAYMPELGYLFQEVLRPHESIVDLLGNDAISGVRVILVQDESGIDFVSAEWKMAIGDNDTDNIRDYARGNMSGEIELNSGRLQRVVDGKWPSAELMTHVPTTGRALEGFVLPNWNETLALCRYAARMFPLMRIQHWDIALTDRGPCLLEVNDKGSLAGQVYGKGFLTPRVRSLLQRHGNPAKHLLAKRLTA